MKAGIKRALLRPAHFMNIEFLYVDRVTMACARGALAHATRRLDPADTATWEFSAFSQNGEDGILDQLLSLVRSPNRYFVEIGAADGLENNSSYLALVKKYSGLMVEGDPVKARRAEDFLQPMNLGVSYLSLFVNKESVAQLKDACLELDPDVFSLDIDGNDFYVAERLVQLGLRPKVVCVEYNSAFGPERSITIEYDPGFSGADADASQLYYGVSIAGWRTFWEGLGYRFVTVDSNGVNAFFVDPQAVDDGFLQDLRNIEFQENYWQRNRFRTTWEQQFELIAHMPFVPIG